MTPKKRSGGRVAEHAVVIPLSLEGLPERKPDATLRDLARAAGLLGLELHFRMRPREPTVRELGAVDAELVAAAVRDFRRGARRAPRSIGSAAEKLRAVLDPCGCGLVDSTDFETRMGGSQARVSCSCGLATGWHAKLGAAEREWAALQGDRRRAGLKRLGAALLELRARCARAELYGRADVDAEVVTTWRTWVQAPIAANDSKGAMMASSYVPAPPGCYAKVVEPERALRWGHPRDAAALPVGSLELRDGEDLLAAVIPRLFKEGWTIVLTDRLGQDGLRQEDNLFRTRGDAMDFVDDRLGGTRKPDRDPNLMEAQGRGLRWVASTKLPAGSADLRSPALLLASVRRDGPRDWVTVGNDLIKLEPRHFTTRLGAMQWVEGEVLDEEHGKPSSELTELPDERNLAWRRVAALVTTYTVGSLELVDEKTGLVAGVEPVIGGTWSAWVGAGVVDSERHVVGGLATRRDAMVWVEDHAGQATAGDVDLLLEVRGEPTGKLDPFAFERLGPGPERDARSRAFATWADQVREFVVDREDRERFYTDRAKRCFLAGYVAGKRAGNG